MALQVAFGAAVGVVGLAIALQLFVTFYYLGKCLFLPFDNSAPESMGVWQALELARGHGPYQNFFQPPFTIGFYGPLHYGVAALFIRLLHLKWLGALALGRGLAVLASCGSVALFILWCRREGVRRGAMLVALALLLTQRWILSLAVSYRPDMPGLCLTLAGLFILTGRRWRWLGVVCLFCAVFYKQSYIAAPLALGLEWCRQRRWKEIAFYLAPLVCAGVVMVGAMQWATGGLYLLNVAKMYTLTPIEYRSKVFIFRDWLMPESLMAGMLIAGACCWHAARRRDVLLIYFLLSLGYNLFLIGNQGSSFYYLAEPLVVGMLLVARWLDRLEFYGKRIAALALAPAAWLILTSPEKILIYFGLDAEPLKKNYAEVERLTQAAPDEWVLSMDSMAVLRSGGRPVLMDALRWNLFCDHKLIDLAPYVSLMRQKQFRYVIGVYRPGGKFWEMEPMKGFPEWEMKNYYKITRVVGKFAIAEPR